jgi:hypothetical protein
VAVVVSGGRHSALDERERGVIMKPLGPAYLIASSCDVAQAHRADKPSCRKVVQREVPHVGGDLDVRTKSHLRHGEHDLRVFVHLPGIEQPTHQPPTQLSA